MWTIAVNTLVVVIPIIGSVLGALVAGGAVAFYLAKPNKDKIAAEIAVSEEEKRNVAVDSVTKALDRQDKTIADLDKKAKALEEQAKALEEQHAIDAKTIEAFNSTVTDLGNRVLFLEDALTAAGVAAHVGSDEEEAEAAIAEGRVVLLKREQRANDDGEDDKG